ncbi:hypothetical protein Y1Q_0009925 [Alligator mississippiensis]|uniref:Uncharacterized protein n=1 Tax=Alligator mississippiensis TaxID=8496 RepID=A0A151MXG8_ALLMI|nr:hypothetical protein Y1Q_0009925 [Alligator mississippiensis]
MLDTEGEDISEGAEALLDNTFLMRPVTLVLEKRNCFCDKQSLSRADRVLRELLIRKIANTSNFSHGEKKYLPPGGQSASQQSQDLSSEKATDALRKLTSERNSYSKRKIRTHMYLCLYPVVKATPKGKSEHTCTSMSLPCSESNTSKGGDVPENRLPETLKSQESD